MDEVTTMSEVKQIPQPFGPRLQVARENAGLSQAELASRVGVMLGTVRAWENDKRKPRPNRMQMLAGILSVPLTWLLEGRENAYMEAQHELAAPADAPRTEPWHPDIAQFETSVPAERSALRPVTTSSRHQATDVEKVGARR